MNLRMGEYNNLEVLRETDFSYILNNIEEEVFLHKKQITGELEIGDFVEVFLYFDNQKRITATMNKPFVDKTNPAFLDVVDVNHRLGVFLNIGLIKDLLLSRDDLPLIRKEWPQKGDRLFARLRTSKNQLTAKLIPRYDIEKYLQPTEVLVEGETYKALNVYKTEEGNVFFTEQGHYIYVYFKHMRKIYRIGEEVEVKITIVKEHNRYNGTLIKQKELMLDQDAQYIKTYIEHHGGEMVFTDKTSAEVINEVFHMSKSAFKRAIGTLYKNKVIILDKDKTRLAPVEIVE